MKNKRGSEDLYGYELVVILICTIFFVVAMNYPIRASGNSAQFEQVYSKQIAILIDRTKPGTEIVLDISELLEKAEKNNYHGNIVYIDNVQKTVNVNVISGGGHSYGYFSSSGISWKVDKENNKLIMELK